MSIATLERTPPAFFKQGTSAFTKLVLLMVLSVLLMVADRQWTWGPQLRNVAATVLQPLQVALAQPVQGARWLAGYLQGLHQAQQNIARLEQGLLQTSGRTLSLESLQEENQALRALLGLQQNLSESGLGAQVVYQVADPLRRQWVINRGARHGVTLGAAVVDAYGVAGQITQVQPWSATATLVIDGQQVTPVRNARTGQYGVLYGLGEANTLALRYTPNGSDVQPGDVLVTSGIDGVYPVGLRVASVVYVRPQADASFADIGAKPLSAVDATQFLLVMPRQDETEPEVKP
ncbi:MAG: rod shape-determining protein MreC [Burkholderiaceae bacterium]